MGLIKKCLVAAKENEVLKISKIFNLISFSDIADMAFLRSSEEAVSIVSKLVPFFLMIVYTDC